MTGLALALLALVAAASGLAAQGAPGAAAIPAVSPAAACSATAPDADADGLADGCELALARTFAPLLVVRPGGCNWDESVRPARPGGGYLFAARPLTDGAVRIAYLPAYHRDCGWHGAKCWLPFVDCAPHAGDSEFIVEDVRPDSSLGRWVTEAVFLSAHCFGRHGEACRWYRGDELRGFEWDGGERAAPVIWVAEGRQANYPDKGSCDRGIHHIDTCDHNALRIIFPIETPAQNIGSASSPSHAGGCVEGRALWPSSREDPRRTECFWDPANLFAGWQDDGPGVTPYRRYLTEIAGFE
ncbi:MAG TPA: hypothetical protein VFQ38_11075 [Longimicrobiales bacterium]|nr:hypothetical protein [Longimicrobiales bacterium]